MTNRRRNGRESIVEIIRRWKGCFKELGIVRGINPFGDEVVNSEVSRSDCVTDKASSVAARGIFRLRTTFFGNIDMNETTEGFEAAVIR
jgi:hypothetical protein